MLPNISPNGAGAKKQSVRDVKRHSILLAHDSST